MAGSMVVADDRILGPQGDARLVELTCTHHTDNSFSVTSAEIRTSDGKDILPIGTLEGWCLDMISTFPGATAPTDATDLTIKDDFGIDLLETNGTDAVDATTGVAKNAELNTFKHAIPIIGTLTFATANNAVASAIFTLRLYLVRPGARS